MVLFINLIALYFNTTKRFFNIPKWTNFEKSFSLCGPANDQPIIGGALTVLWALALALALPPDVFALELALALPLPDTLAFELALAEPPPLELALDDALAEPAAKD